MKTLKNISLSMLDLVSVRESGTVADALAIAWRTAQHAEQLVPAQPGQHLIAMPGEGTNVPIWLRGSSLFSAQLAAERGLPYAFVCHFAPRLLMQAIGLYRQHFLPSAELARLYLAIGVPLIAAATDDEAECLASSTYQWML